MVTLSQSELNKAFVLQRVVDGHLTIREAAQVLGLSERHTKRLKKKFLPHGAAGLTHGNRDRKPAHAEKVLHLAQTKYRGCSYTFLSELLSEYEGFSLSPSSSAVS